MNVLGHDDLSKSLGINPDIELAGGCCSDLEVSIWPGDGLAQNLTGSTGIVTDEMNRCIRQPVPLRVGDLTPQGNVLSQERNRQPSQHHDKNCQVFPM